MISCPSCGGEDRVQIRTRNHDTSPRWIASCEGCGAEWDLADPLTVP